ncbi:MAG: EpsG family protein [Armatimonadota bacterium]
MLVYAILLTIIVVLYPLFSRDVVDIDGHKFIVNSKKYVVIVAGLLALLIGFRGLTVGIDTTQYFDTFQTIRGMDTTSFFSQNSEVGYRILQYVVDYALGNFQYLLVIEAILYMGVIAYHIYRYSSSPVYSYLLFVVYGFYTFSMSTIRQTIAMAIVMIAYEYIKKKNLPAFLGIVLLASSFHQSALVFLPSYWFNKFRLNQKSLAVLAVTGLLMFYYRGYIQNIIRPLSRSYYGDMETGGSRMYLLLLVTVILGVVYSRALHLMGDNNRYLLFMMIASAVIMPITQFNPVVMRLYFYYFIFMIIYIPNLVFAISNKVTRITVGTAYLVTGALYFFLSSLSGSQLESYRFFWQ